MNDLLLAMSGFGWGALHDIAALRSTPRVKPFLLTMVVLSHGFGIIGLLRHSERWRAPTWLRAACLVLAPASFAAMFYSIFIEVPLRKAWIDRGHTDQLVTTGTYALTRHPGVTWYAMALLTSAVATRSVRMLLALPLLIAADIAHVRFQDQVTLPAVFGDAYREYQRTTPFVVPTPSSIGRFVQTLARAPLDDVRTSASAGLPAESP